MYVTENDKTTAMCCLWLLDASSASLATDAAAVARFAGRLQRRRAQSKWRRRLRLLRARVARQNRSAVLKAGNLQPSLSPPPVYPKCYS